MQVIQVVILLVVLIMIMRHCGFDVMLFLLYLHRQVLLTGSPECAGLWTLRMSRHR
jgi:hypothetical protein